MTSISFRWPFSRIATVVQVLIAVVGLVAYLVLTLKGPDAAKTSATVGPAANCAPAPTGIVAISTLAIACACLACSALTLVIFTYGASKRAKSAAAPPDAQ